MTITTLDRPATTMAATTFSVVVVDGSGREVYAVPVTARFDIGGRAHIATSITGPDGEARFAGSLAGSDTVTLMASGESLGPIHPRHRARLVIET